MTRMSETKTLKKNKLAAVCVLGLGLIAFPVNAMGQSGKRKPASEEASTGSAQKVDTAEFEKGYWATQNQEMSVIQNRTFTKAHKKLLSVNYGIMVNDSYSDGSVLGVAGQYFWSERMGVQLTYQGFSPKNNKMTDSLIINNGQMPDHNKPISFYGASFNWVPIYGKMSLLEKKVMYFDMSLSPGLGYMNYEQQVATGNRSQQALAYTLDVTQHFFVSQHWAFRVDYANRWYTEKKLDYVDNNNNRNTGRELSQDFIHASQIMLGVTFYFQ